MSAQSPQNLRLCLPGEHHLYAQVNGRAKVVLSPDERTFEFWGDYEPNLRIVGVECVECDLYVANGDALPKALGRSASTPETEATPIPGRP